MANSKTLVLIDGSNIFHAISAIGDKEHPYRVNYQKLLAILEEKVGPIIKKAYYSAEPPSKVRDVRSKYTKCLKAMGLDVHSLPLKVKMHKCKQCGNEFETFVEKGVDLALATEALRHGYQGLCNAVVLVSGSGVYIPVVEALQGAGIYVVVAAFKQHCTVSNDLITRADNFIDLSTLVEELRLTFDNEVKPVNPDVAEAKNPYA